MIAEGSEKKSQPPGAYKKKTGALKTISPIAFWMLSFFIAPLFLIIIVSFLTRGQYGDIEYTLTGSNYIKLFNPLYVKIFVSSLVISVATTLLCLLLGYPFAYSICRVPKKYRSLLLLLIILPFWTNSLIRTYAWIILLRSEGIINSILLSLKIINEPLKLLYNNSAVLLGMVYIMFPFMVLPLYSSIEKLDRSLIEASSDLGAKPYKTFMKVTLPLTLPGILSGCILVLVPTLGYFFIPDLMGGSKIILVSNFIKNQFLSSRNWPLGSAASVFLILIMIVVIGLYLFLGGNKDKMEVM